MRFHFVLKNCYLKTKPHSPWMYPARADALFCFCSTCQESYFSGEEKWQLETGYPGCGCTDNDRDVAKISGCWVNTTSRQGIKHWNSWGFLLVLFFFYFPMKVAKGWVQHGKREVYDILYKKMDTWQRTEMEFQSSKNQDFRGQSYPNISQEGSALPGWSLTLATSCTVWL